jgi:predicted metal-dependent enzyme (double-stranded beta helix superfamily)
MPDLRESEPYYDLPLELTLESAVLLLDRLSSDLGFLASHVLPILREPPRSEPFYVSHQHDYPDGSALQVFVWAPGSRTPVRDHSAWGAFRCVVGTIVEERYERLDHSSRPGYARLRKAWRQVWGKHDGASTLLPFEGGIHRVGNPTERTAISLHVYGSVDAVDGRDYDPSRFYVCDRLE